MQHHDTYRILSGMTPPLAVQQKQKIIVVGRHHDSGCDNEGDDEFYSTVQDLKALAMATA